MRQVILSKYIAFNSKNKYIFKNSNKYLFELAKRALGDFSFTSILRHAKLI